MRRSWGLSILCISLACAQVSKTQAPAAHCGPVMPLIAYSEIESDKGELGGQLVAKDVKSARVKIVDIDAGSRMYTARADEYGTFLVTNVDPGMYVVRTHLNGYFDFIIDSVEVKRGQRTRLFGMLELKPCSKRDCDPITMVQPETCGSSKPTSAPRTP